MLRSKHGTYLLLTVLLTVCKCLTEIMARRQFIGFYVLFQRWYVHGDNESEACLILAYLLVDGGA
jgi:hypothetical protein